MFKRLAMSVVLVAAVALAQGGRGGGGDEGGGGGGGGMGGGGMEGGGGMPMRAMPKSKLEIFAEKLKLSDPQKEELVKILTAGREEAAPLRTEMDSGRVAIANAMLGNKAEDEKKFLEAYGNFAGQMVDFEAKGFTKIVATLKSNQQSKAGQAFPYLAGVFDSTTGGRGGAGRGMGGNRGGGGRK